MHLITREMLMLIIPVVVLQFFLIIMALLDIRKRTYVKGGNKVVWILIVLFFGIIGPLVYFVFGRKE